MYSGWNKINHYLDVRNMFTSSLNSQKHDCAFGIVIYRARMSNSLPLARNITKSPIILCSTNTNSRNFFLMNEEKLFQVRNLNIGCRLSVLGILQIYIYIYILYKYYYSITSNCRSRVKPRLNGSVVLKIMMMVVEVVIREVKGDGMLLQWTLIYYHHVN